MQNDTFERVEKALSGFYGENCKKDFKCKDYKDYNSALCYLLECLDGKEPECVSNVTYSLAEVELVSLQGFKCLVKDAFNHKYNPLQEVREQDKECDAVFVDAVRCQKATTLDTKTTTICTTKLPTINYKTSSIPPKTSSSTAKTTTPPPPPSSLSSTISNSGNMESQEQRLQREVISVSTLLAISLIANIILLLGVVYLWTRGRRQHEGLSPAMPELAVLNTVEVHHLISPNATA
ncbi:uncharacterized protein LOC121570255 [Coregonus clupeaformis]|uniref:uncharacterized protein LOC121570255 n=1 Tax=Coregonus clupeaformis TaxID=59861 RepID=UPI001BE01F59|nr:uncharacterized protein LOC121570255 [Coregonus clupeaformis]